MINYMLAIILLCIMLLIFMALGNLISEKMRLDQGSAFNLVMGCFVFFAAFSPWYLVCLFFRLNVIALGIGELLIFGALLFYSFKSKITIGTGFQAYRGIIISNLPYYLLLFLSSGLLFYYTIRVSYHGWDTTYYVKEISNTAEYGSLYQVWTANNLGEAIKLRHGLCSYYAFLGLISKISRIPAIIVARVIGGGACVLLSVLTTYCLAKEIFKDIKDVLMVTILCNFFNFFSISIYTASAFLMQRSYEGKAWCSNVIIPFLLLLFLHLYLHEEKKLLDIYSDSFNRL